MLCPHCHKPIAPKRSAAQSRAFHAMCGAFGRQMGQGAEDVKILFKYLHSDWVSMADIMRGERPEWPGSFVKVFPRTSSERIIFSRSEASLSTREEKDLIDGAIAECHDADVDIDRILEGMEENERQRRIERQQQK